VITGIANDSISISRNDWTFFEAAHIFPLAAGSLFISGNLSRWNKAPTGDSGINSVQNGLLLSRHVHAAFDQYLISINPDVCIP
jgi:hypothetical protein